MYTLPWIIDNMILEPKETTKLRPPSDAELRVQKSLQQLTVPDWYANKCVASPKIIVDRRPFEIRPAPWKDPIRNRAPLRNPWKNSAVAKPVVDSKKMPRSELEKSSGAAKTPNVKSTPSYSSKTFPKISPSRKIQNINIVFPTTTAATSQTKLVGPKNDKVTAATDSLDKSIASIDSLEKFTPKKTSTFENKPPPIKNPTPKNFKINCSSKSREKFNFDNPGLSGSEEFADTEKILISPVAKSGFTGSLTPEKQERISPTAPASPLVAATTSEKNLSNYLADNSASENVFLTPKKSTEMESIIKNEQKRSSGKSFVEEIIQELNAKCNSRVKSNYTSPTSKNFVKKLVRALEMGCVPKRDEDQDKIFQISNQFEPSSVSTSTKDSDSGSGSDSEIKSSASHISVEDGEAFRSFSKALEDRGTTPRESVIPYVDDEDDSVYWIPLPSCRLPRTSSLKNMISRLSSHGGTSSPISSSPDPADNPREYSTSWQPTNLQNFSVSGWGKTFDKKYLRSRRLFRINETTVIDSGYSDRSETNSSSSSSVIDETWYESESTQTASEIGEDYENFTFSSHSRPRNNPGHWQRASFV